MKKIHGNHGITSLKGINTYKDSSTRMLTIRTTGHDGTIKQIIVTPDKARVTFTVRSIPIKWIERVQDNFIFGFNDSHFVCYNFDEGIVFEIDCGGGHRMWDVNIFDSDNYFTFIQHKKVQVIELNRYISSNLGVTAQSVIKFSNIDWHISACNTATIVDDSLLVTGGESNELKIFKIDPSEKSVDTIFKPFSTSKAHISSIKHTFVMIDPIDGDPLIISFGGRAQICVTRVLNKSSEVIEELSYSLLASDAERSRNGLAQELLTDPETRFTCGTVSEDSNTFILGCSDGYIRQFKLEKTEESFTITLITKIYYGKCILNIKTLQNEDLITMATDGLVVFWKLNQTFEPYYKLLHHQSGIDCFDIYHEEETGEYTIATGGDDQAISITKFTFDPDSMANHGFKLISTKTYKNLHTAQVTGIKFVNKNTLISAGVDQMIYKFEIGVEPVVLYKYFTNVADIKGLTLKGQLLVIYGNGVEIKII